MPGDQLTVCTAINTWVIPHDCEILKALLTSRNIQAADLQFEDRLDCQNFIRSVALLAATDEMNRHVPSSLRDLTQELLVGMTKNVQAQQTLQNR